MHSPDQPKEPRRPHVFRVLGRRVLISRSPAEGPVAVARLMLITGAIVGMAVTVFHEFTYRKTGGDEFELFGTISHAGSDMLMVLGFTLAAMVGVRSLAAIIRDRGAS